MALMIRNTPQDYSGTSGQIRQSPAIDPRILGLTGLNAVGAFSPTVGQMQSGPAPTGQTGPSTPDYGNMQDPIGVTTTPSPGQRPPPRGLPPVPGNTPAGGLNPLLGGVTGGQYARPGAAGVTQYGLFSNAGPPPQSNAGGVPGGFSPGGFAPWQPTPGTARPPLAPGIPGAAGPSTGGGLRPPGTQPPGTKTNLPMPTSPLPQPGATPGLVPSRTTAPTGMNPYQGSSPAPTFRPPTTRTASPTAPTVNLNPLAGALAPTISTDPSRTSRLTGGGGGSLSMPGAFGSTRR